MNFSPGQSKVIVRRASEVNLQDGHQLYRTRALPLWVLWRQERKGEGSTQGARNPYSGNPATVVSRAKEEARDKEREKKELIRKVGWNPFLMLT